MVSGFLTSPLDQDRMASGDATEIATCSTRLTLSRPNSSRADSLELIITLYATRKRFHYPTQIQIVASARAESGSSSGLEYPTLTSRPRDCISLTNTLNDSGMPASSALSPLTMLS